MLLLLLWVWRRQQEVTLLQQQPLLQLLLLLCCRDIKGPGVQQQQQRNINSTGQRQSIHLSEALAAASVGLFSCLSRCCGCCCCYRCCCCCCCCPRLPWEVQQMLRNACTAKNGAKDMHGRVAVIISQPGIRPTAATKKRT